MKYIAKIKDGIVWQVRLVTDEYQPLEDERVVTQDEQSTALDVELPAVMDEDGHLSHTDTWVETPDISGEVPTVKTTTAQDDTDAMLVDHEYRITLLELGVTE